MRFFVIGVSALFFVALSASASPRTTALPNGLVGEFFPASSGKGPLVLTLGGSDGGLPRDTALDLNAHGFSALALAYFGAPGVPAKLASIPLEYFDAAVAWLAGQPSEHRRVAIVGVSKGAEAALLIASRNPRVCALVAGAPSSVSWTGVDKIRPTEAGPSWTAGGRPIPYVPYDSSVPYTTPIDLYTRSLEKAPKDAAIPVERIRGGVLLVSGRQDAIWPAATMGEQIMARLDAAHFSYVHRHLAYQDAGHLAFGEPPPPGTKVPPALLAASGGTAEGNIAARVDSWPKLISFLDREFATDCD